jgi:hypothetical protein
MPIQAFVPPLHHERIYKAKPVKVQLVGAREECPVLQLLRYLAAPLAKVLHPSFYFGFRRGLWLPVQEVADRPTQIFRLGSMAVCF